MTHGESEQQHLGWEHHRIYSIIWACYILKSLISLGKWILKHLLPFCLPQKSLTPSSSQFAASASFAERGGCSAREWVPFPQVPTDKGFITPISFLQFYSHNLIFRAAGEILQNKNDMNDRLNSTGRP